MTQYMIGPAQVFMAQTELARQLREAKLAGWRAGREAAAVLVADLPFNAENSREQAARVIRAIPEPEEL